MKASSFAIHALALVACASAFPTTLNQIEAGPVPAVKDLRSTSTFFNFNAEQQYVSNQGDHAFVAPGPTDVRGPCPGLNAAANHGYLPHSGVGTNKDFITGTYEAFGMGQDLGLFLTAVGSVFDGDLLSWSIGGPSGGAIPLGLLGQPQGISGSHNKYESDVSPTRGDLYLHGNDYELQMDQFLDLYDAGQANGDNYTLDLLNEFRSARFDHSLQNNPYFFNGPFSGVLVQPAAYQFIPAFFGNKSEEFPSGHLNGDVLMSFFSVVKNDDGSFTHTPGHEKIPDNWYKRAIGDPYGLPLLNVELVATVLQYPKFASIGGNTGEPNSFVGVAPENLTAGVFNAATLLEGNNLACFAIQVLAQSSLDLITESGVLSDVLGAVNNLTSVLGPLTADLSCPNLTKIDVGQFKQFPGYTNLKADGQY